MKTLNKNWFTLLFLALAGGLVYKIPYLKYVYYDAMITALEVDNTQLGIMVSAFGFTSMVFYFLGGWVADRFQPKTLLAFTFVSLGGLGLLYSTFPPYEVLVAIHALFGAIISLTYWSVALKAVRMLSSGEDIGKMFGFYESGKQVSGLLTSYMALALFAMVDDKTFGISMILVVYSICLIVTGIAIFFMLKDVQNGTNETESSAISFREIFVVMKDSRAWLFGLLIFSIYHFHIGLNTVTPYLTQHFGLSVAWASGISMFCMYVLGSLGAAGAGVMVDKLGSTLKVIRLISVGAILVMTTYVLLPTDTNLLYLIIVIWALAQFLNFAMRGVYFSSLKEIGVSVKETGLFIGFASFIGFIPDTYFHGLQGIIMDNFEGALGFKIIFGYILLMTVICFIAITVLAAKHTKEAAK
ncbi:MFS transporter [Vibrio jasicida]|uniref:MFS transporter n=1 Tax=Vibrio jasicida TaxID=766224 RepID=UPI000CE4183A|nr:MFS transporter [Vibrio jasicida]